jgi:hypothetical protein
MTPINTYTLRKSYEKGVFSFGNPDAGLTIALIGSCRVLYHLNGLLAYNAMSGNPFELLCFNPVEMWKGPGTDVGDCATEILKDYRMDGVDILISEHTVRCGVLNTAVGPGSPNVFDSLGCNPDLFVRLPNWSKMHLFDEETAMWDASYAALPPEARVPELQKRSEGHKQRFIDYCKASSFPSMAEWVADEWLNTRMGWTSNHPSIPLTWRLFNGVAGKLGITITPELAAHPFCATDIFESTGIKLNEIDYKANHWKF